MADTTITRATPADAAKILALQRRAYQSEAALYPTIALPPLTEMLSELTIEFNRSIFLKAVENALIVGSIRAYELEGVCRIGRLIVEPARQGNGIGTALLTAIESEFSNAAYWELFTGSLSARNLRLYERAGYAECRREQAAPELTLVYLRKARG